MQGEARARALGFCFRVISGLFPGVTHIPHAWGVTILEGKLTRKVEAKVRGLLSRTRGSESEDWRGTSFNCFPGDKEATCIYLALSSQGA